MATVTIYHNPRCSKSRKTLELLRQHGIEPTVIEYMSAPPDVATITRLLAMLALKPRGLIRSKEYGALDLPASNDDAELIARLAAHPEIMQRPIVVAGHIAVLGRPPENVLDIL